MSHIFTVVSALLVDIQFPALLRWRMAGRGDGLIIENEK